VVVGYTEEVVVHGTQGSKTVVAKSDTGATRTSIDTSLAAEIGAGPIKSVMKVKSGSLKSGKSRPVVDLVVGVGGRQHTVTASVEDRSHMDYPLLLGRDILGNYQVDVSKTVDGDTEANEEEEETLEEEPTSSPAYPARLGACSERFERPECEHPDRDRRGHVLRLPGDERSERRGRELRRVRHRGEDGGCGFDDEHCGDDESGEDRRGDELECALDAWWYLVDAPDDEDERRLERERPEAGDEDDEPERRVGHRHDPSPAGASFASSRANSSADAARTPRSAATTSETS
jgi:hypothetical protein